MSFNREKIEDLIFGQSGQRRFTQDSPILPDVWIAYCRDISRPVDLLLNPRRESSPPELHKALSERLVKKTDESPNPWSLAYNESYVAADLSFEELICIVLPLSGLRTRSRWCSY